MPPGGTAIPRKVKVPVTSVRVSSVAPGTEAMTRVPADGPPASAFTRPVMPENVPMWMSTAAGVLVLPSTTEAEPVNCCVPTVFASSETVPRGRRDSVT